MKFSFIICTYNSAGRLPKTLDSILAQTWDDYEVIVVDGSSIDGIMGVIDEYEKKFDGKLKWISEKDTGIYNAMNKGIRMANGEFLNVVGAGDWIEKDALENAARCIEENPGVDAVFGKTLVWNEDLNESRTVQTYPESLPENPMQHPSLFYKKNLHDYFGYYDESYRIAADYAFCLKAFHEGNAYIVSLDSVVANFVMDGVSSKNQIAAIREGVRALESVGLSDKRLLWKYLTYYKKKIIG